MLAHHVLLEAGASGVGVAAQLANELLGVFGIVHVCKNNVGLGPSEIKVTNITSSKQELISRQRSM